MMRKRNEDGVVPPIGALTEPHLSNDAAMEAMD